MVLTVAPPLSLFVSIKGEQGEDREIGLTGKPGQPGKTGVPGLPGSRGSFGPKVRPSWLMMINGLSISVLQ